MDAGVVGWLAEGLKHGANSVAEGLLVQLGYLQSGKKRKLSEV